VAELVRRAAQASGEAPPDYMDGEEGAQMDCADRAAALSSDHPGLCSVEDLLLEAKQLAQATQEGTLWAEFANLRLAPHRAC